MKAKTHRRKRPRTQIRVAKMGNAREAIGTLATDEDLYILTFGQFSLIHALDVLLEQTGPANVDIATWTAANAHLDDVAGMLEAADITRMRFVVDRSFISRQPAYCKRMRERFGDESIRTCRTHAKFMVISNDEWQIAIRTSMNLNENPRLETIEISTDKQLCGFLRRVVDDLFSEKAGDFAGDVPGLSTIENIPLPGILHVREPTAGTATAKQLELRKP